MKNQGFGVRLFLLYHKYFYSATLYNAHILNISAL